MLRFTTGALRLILVGCLGTAAERLEATSVQPPSFEQLVGRADCIVRGETTGTRSEWRGQGPTRRIVTLVTFRVSRRIVGTAPETLELEFLGGAVDGRTLVVTDQPRFRPGDRDILFVANNGRQVCPLVAMMYGRYSVAGNADDPRQLRVMRENGAPLGSVGEVARPMAAPGERTAQAVSSVQAPMTVADFEASIRQTATALGRKDLTP